jgi:threonine synthase
VAVTDEETHRAWQEFAALTGIFAAPEGAATYAALKQLVATRWVQPHERVVLFNTGSGVKYLEAWFQEEVSHS